LPVSARVTVAAKRVKHKNIIILFIPSPSAISYHKI